MPRFVPVIFWMLLPTFFCFKLLAKGEFSSGKIKDGAFHIQDGSITEFVNLHDSAQNLLAFHADVPALDTSRLAKEWMERGMTYLDQDEYSQAIIYLDSALQYYQHQPDSSRLNALYNNLGVVYDHLGDYNQALNMYFQSLEVLEPTEDAEAIVTAYNNIGLVLAAKGKHEEALRYYRKGGELAENQQLSVSRSYILHNMGELFADQKAYQKSLKHYAQALAIDEVNDDREGIAINLYSMARVYMTFGDYEQAAQNLKKSLEISESTGDRLGILNCYLLMGKMDMLREAQIPAIDHTLRALKMARQLKAKREVSQAAGQLSRLYRQVQDYEQALRYNDLYHDYTDSLYREDESKRLALMEVEQQKAENALLQAENQLKATMLNDQQMLIEKQTYLVIFVSFVLIVCVIVVSLLFNANEDKFKTNQQLVRQKEEIENIIEELTELNDNIKLQKEELERSNHVKDKLLSIVSHDFRSPLNSLEGMLDLVACGALTDKEIQGIAAELRIKVNITTGLLDNLLNWAKNQMQGIEVQPEDFAILALVEDTIQLLSIQAERKQVRLLHQLTASYKVFADYEMIKLVLRNLVSNAIKFSGNGDEVIIGSYTEKNRLVLMVSDSGTGINAEELARLFTTEARSTIGTANEKGTGLGLQLCHDFVKINEGNIWVESVPDEGSTFYFSVPLAAKQKNELPHGSHLR